MLLLDSLSHFCTQFLAFASIWDQRPHWECFNINVIRTESGLEYNRSRRKLTIHDIQLTSYTHKNELSNLCMMIFAPLNGHFVLGVKHFILTYARFKFKYHSLGSALPETSNISGAFGMPSIWEICSLHDGMYDVLLLRTGNNVFEFIGLLLSDPCIRIYIYDNQKDSFLLTAQHIHIHENEMEHDVTKKRKRCIKLFWTCN